jgi:hypothetical protein
MQSNFTDMQVLLKINEAKFERLKMLFFFFLNKIEASVQLRDLFQQVNSLRVLFTHAVLISRNPDSKLHQDGIKKRI